MPYIPVDITTDVDTLYQTGIDNYQTYYPNWEPDEASVVSILLSVSATLAYEQLYAVSQQFDNIYVDFGEELYGIPFLEPTFATAATTWVASDTVGHTVPAGTQVLIGGVGFTVDVDVAIPPGSTSTAEGEVIVTAINSGTDSNGLTGDADAVESFAWLDSITVVGVSAGGSAGETAEDYRNRLVDELATVSPTAVTATDYLLFARRVPGVYRAVVLDGYKPYTNLLTTNQANIDTTDISGWTGGASTTISRSTAQASAGASSLLMTRTGTTGTASATTTPATPIVPGGTYTARAVMRAATTARSSQLGIQWYDASSVALSLANGTAANDSTSAWTTYSVTATAPTNAAYAAVVPQALAAVASEGHYVDSVGLKLGTDATWTANDTNVNVYDAATRTWGNPGYVTVSTIDVNGQPGPKDDVLADLNARRMTGLFVGYADPFYNTINVSASITVDTTRYVGLDVVDAVTNAIEDYLSPAEWGKTGETTSDDRSWRSDSYVRRDELFTVINNTLGVEHVDSLSINGNTTTNVLMNGAVPLPQPGTIAVVVS